MKIPSLIIVLLGNSKRPSHDLTPSSRDLIKWALDLWWVVSAALFGILENYIKACHSDCKLVSPYKISYFNNKQHWPQILTRKSTEIAGSLSGLELIVILEVAKGIQINLAFLKSEQNPPKSHTNFEWSQVLKCFIFLQID